ncbi:unnamed protein product [Pipistrellus nathusii]|uniref:Uncharacterized protein n=1 Tax=Pipistrellus nathusii TaxID=59473 RepID=A0ABN9ZV88_PIPNA
MYLYIYLYPNIYIYMQSELKHNRQSMAEQTIKRPVAEHGVNHSLGLACGVSQSVGRDLSRCHHLPSLRGPMARGWTGALLGGAPEEGWVKCIPASSTSRQQRASPSSDTSGGGDSHDLD